VELDPEELDLALGQLRMGRAKRSAGEGDDGAGETKGEACAPRGVGGSQKIDLYPLAFGVGVGESVHIGARRASLAASRGRREVDRLARHDSVEDVWIEIDTVRPNDRTEVRVDPHLGEARRITQGSEQSIPANDSVEVYLPLDSVGEAQVETVISDRPSLSGVYEHISF
jgi:hypothetical protein